MALSAQLRASVHAQLLRFGAERNDSSSSHFLSSSSLLLPTSRSKSQSLSSSISGSSAVHVSCKGSQFTGYSMQSTEREDIFSMTGPYAGQGTAQRSSEADVMGLLLRQRIVFLGCEMDDYVADAIVSQLLLLDAQNPNEDIRLFINCPGGSISSAMAIFDAIQLCRAPVSTIAFGLAASTAALILAAGSKGKRLAMPNARIMMHQPLGGASGQAIDVEIQAKEIMHHKTNITRILSQITRRPYDQVAKDIDRDRYMSPVEAMEYGITDGVIDQDMMMPIVPMPERVKSRKENLDAEKDYRKFLIPTIPDEEIY